MQAPTALVYLAEDPAFLKFFYLLEHQNILHFSPSSPLITLYHGFITIIQ